jgi:hypothetical protein
MIEKNAEFYMANIYPEIGRMFRAYDDGKKELAEGAKYRAVKIADQILSFKDLKPAGKEEWFAVKNLILGYEKLDSFSRTILETFGQPFAFKFMSKFSARVASGI